MSELETAFDELVASLAGAVEHVRSHPFYAEEENRAGAHLFVVGMLLARLEGDVVFDPDFPSFRVIDTRIREGGDNPDQRYSMANLRGGQTYRIWGHLGSARRLDVQVYAGDPFRPGSGGRSASFLSFEDLRVGEDGRFEVLLSPEQREWNWLENPADGTEVLVRQVYSDWTDADPGEVHIDRVGSEGSSKPPLAEAELAARFRLAADDLRNHTAAWPAMVELRYLAQPVNEISPPMDPGALGGVPGRWMAGGTWDLGEDEALVVETWPHAGNYQGIQLADLWFSSLEYANRQTSLTAGQAFRNDAGSYRFVVSHRDPGVANWLDTTGRRRGCILLRFDGSTEAFAPAHVPRAWKVGVAELAAHLPPETPRVTPEERATAIAARRRHVQVRFGT